MDRIAIFIDGGYLNKILKNEFNSADIDYGKLAATVAHGKEILRTYYYNCPPYQGPRPTPNQKKLRDSATTFFTSLSRLPRFEVRLGKLAYRGMNDKGGLFFNKNELTSCLALILLAWPRQSK